MIAKVCSDITRVAIIIEDVGCIRARIADVLRDLGYKVNAFARPYRWKRQLKGMRAIHEVLLVTDLYDSHLFNTARDIVEEAGQVMKSRIREIREATTHIPPNNIYVFSMLLNLLEEQLSEKERRALLAIKAELLELGIPEKNLLPKMVGHGGMQEGFEVLVSAIEHHAMVDD